MSKCKKIAAMLLAVVLAVSMLAGCGGSGSGGGSILFPSDATVQSQTQVGRNFVTSVKNGIKKELERVGYQWGGFTDSVALSKYLASAIEKTAANGFFNLSSEDLAQNTCAYISYQAAEAMGIDMGNGEMVYASARPASDMGASAVEEEVAVQGLMITVLDQEAKKDGYDLVYAYDAVPVETGGAQYYIIAMAAMKS